MSLLLKRTLFLFPSLRVHTPRWVYDQLSGEMNSFQAIYGIPQYKVDLRGVRCQLRVVQDVYGATCVIEQTGALVLPEGCDEQLITHVVSDQWSDDVTVPIVHLQWFVDCLQSGTRLAVDNYLLLPTSTSIVY